MFADNVTSTDLLSLVQLLNGTIHALLQNSDLLVLLLDFLILLLDLLVQAIDQ